MQLLNIKRVFVTPKGVELPDPSVHMTPNQVREHYTTSFPDLTNALIKDPEVKHLDSGEVEERYVFSLQVGTKG